MPSSLHVIRQFRPIADARNAVNHSANSADSRVPRAARLYGVRAYNIHLRIHLWGFHCFPHINTTHFQHSLNMATLQGSGVPRVKLESVPDITIKPEPMEDTPSPSDEDDDLYEDTGDLDFSQSQQQLWLSHIPRTLWDTLSKLQDDEEMEIGTIRVEGPETNPSRVRAD